MLDRFLGGLSGRLPAISVALVLVVIAGVVVSIFVLPGDEPTAPLPAQPVLPSAPQATSDFFLLTVPGQKKEITCRRSP